MGDDRGIFGRYSTNRPIGSLHIPNINSNGYKTRTAFSICWTGRSRNDSDCNMDCLATNPSDKCCSLRFLGVKEAYGFLECAKLCGHHPSAQPFPEIIPRVLPWTKLALLMFLFDSQQTTHITKNILRPWRFCSDMFRGVLRLHVR